MKKHFAFVLGLSATFVLPGFVLGQSTFTGNGDGTTWNDASNWDAGLPAGANANIGDSFTVSLATDQTSGELDLVGDQSSGTATLNHSAGTLTHGGNWIKVGGAGNTGTYNVSGSAVFDGIGTDGPTVAHIGFAGGSGTLNVSDSASFTALGGEGIRLAANGDASTGTLTVSDTANVNIGSFNSGGPTGSTATVNQTGGTVTSNSWVVVGNFGVGGTATYNISAGTVAATDGNLAIGQETEGTLNVSGTGVVSHSFVANGDQTNSAILVGGISDNGFIQTGTGTLNITGSSASITGADLRIALTEGSVGTLSWTADSGGVTPIVSGDNTEFLQVVNDVDVVGTSNLVLDLSAHSGAGTAGTEYLLVDNSAAVVGTFTGIAEGATVSIGGGNDGTISYSGGSDGFDIVVTAVGSGGGDGDFDDDGDVDCDDLDGYVGNIGVTAAGALAALDIDGDGTISATDANTHITTLVVTSNGVTGTFPGDLNCDGTVNVLGDAFALVSNLNNAATTYSQGDINFDGTVNVLGDAFTLIGNLGNSNED